MKKFIPATLFLFLLVNAAFAGNIPEAVQKSFLQMFPDADSVKWDKENAHEYEAAFIFKNAKYSASFNEEGHWLETEMEMQFDELPEVIQSAFKTNHPQTIPKAVSKITDSEGAIKYEFEFKQGLKIKELFYSEAGAEIKK